MNALSLSAVAVFATVHLSAAATQSLAGKWRFALDRTDAGAAEKWFARELPDSISLPGILQAQGYGDDISTNTPWVTSLGDAWWKIQPAALREHFSEPGKVKFPFLSQPPKHYLGAAWYQREIEIPARSRGERFSLFLERVHWKSTVWLNEKEMGSDMSLSTPHEYDLGLLAPGRHRLTIRVDNRTQLPLAGHLVDSHSISDALGATWNGVVGKIELRATPAVWIDALQNLAARAGHVVHVRGHVKNETGYPSTNKLMLRLLGKSGESIAEKVVPLTIPAGGNDFNATMPWKSESTWDEFNPALFFVSARLEPPGSKSVFESRAPVPGREITARDKDIFINGTPRNLRFTHFGGDFPLTGYPAMDAAAWKKIIQTCKAYGLNGIRCHSWCPPEAAFEAADELGFYLQPECGLWADFGNTETCEFLEAETARILKAYGNHPSFILLSPSNEPRNYSRVLPQWAKDNYAKDPRRLYAACTGWSDPVEVNGGPQFATLVRYGRGQLRNATGWFGGDYSEALQDVHIPVLAHEVGQWCAYPDFDVIKKFTGYLRPGNYEIFKYLAEQNGVLGMDKAFAVASGRFQLECYKEEIEANLRTPGLAGFELLDLHDYLGQGTALVGLLDAFWESKGYTTPEEFRKFCAPVVPLAWLPKRVFTTSEKLDAAIGVSQFGPADLKDAVVRWELRDHAGKVVGACPSNLARTIPVGFKSKCLDFSMELNRLPAPAAYELVAMVETKTQRFENDWKLWLYPSQVENSKLTDVAVTREWPEAEKALAAGGKVLFMPRTENLDAPRCPPMRDVPVFWNIQMTVRPPRNPKPRFDAMLGLLCDTKHPALAEFPTDSYCDWQWTPLINGVRSVNLTAAPRELRPMVWAIDDWNRNWKLGVIFECTVGRGKLLVCTIDLNDEHRGPGAAQLRLSLLDYMSGGKFRPSVALTSPQAQALWTPRSSPATEPGRVFDPDLNDGSTPAARVKR